MIQYRLLNKSRGPAVQAPRIQADKYKYNMLAKHTVELQKGLHLYQDTVVDFIVSGQNHIFIEPEGINTQELYINGLSSSLPEDIQDSSMRTIPALKDAIITRPAYAVEYDFIDPIQLRPSLETHRVRGLFTAGQINGTSGYEEAGGQGLIAGINAALYVQEIKDGKSGRDYIPFTLARSDAYIGVMIDDLVTLGTTEPYRMFTARAEYRLKLRHDTADERLTPKAHTLGLQSDEALERMHEKIRLRSELTALWESKRVK